MQEKKLPLTTVLNKGLLAFAFIILLPVFGFGAAYTWKNVVVPAGGYVSGVEYSRAAPGLLYARTDMGGAYRWDGANSVWIPLTDFQLDWNLYGIESLAPDPKNANIVYAAIGQSYNNSNGYVLASADQGNTWTQYPIGVVMGGNNDGRNAGERLAVDPNLTSKLYFGSRSGGLMVSTNSAAAWAKVAAFPVNGDAGYGLSFVVFNPAGTAGTASQTIYAGVEAMNSGNSNIYRSINGGTGWAVIPGGPTGMVPPHASLGSDGNLWITYASGGYGPNGITTGQVWRLNTTTLAWTNMTPAAGPAGGSGGYSGICVDAQNPQHVIVTTMDWWSSGDKIFSTTNGGGAWSIISNVSNGWNAGPFANYNNNGAIYTRFCSAYDGGSGWMGDVQIDPFNSNNAIYTTGAGVWSSTGINAATQPAGVTWTFTDYGLEETAQLDMTASVAGGVMFSAMGDVDGMRHDNITQSPALGMYCNPSMSSSDGVDFAQLNTNYVVREGHSLWAAAAGGYSTDNGVSWIAFGSNPNGCSTTNNNGDISVNANGSVILWSLPGSIAVYSTNNGTTWNNTTGLPNGAYICSDRANNTIFYGVSGTNLYVSSNSGLSFAAAGTFAGGLSWNNRPRAVFGIAGEVWVPTGSGLYRFTNVGLGAVTTTKIANVSSASAVGFGKAAAGYTHPAVYLVGTVSGQYGFFRCDDGVGTAWTRINDNNHQFGGPGFACGDEQVYGRMYLGTNGRGILCGDIAAAATVTYTPTRTATPVITPTFTGTAGVTNTKTITLTYTPTYTFTAAASFTSTQTQTVILTRTNTPSYTNTYTQTFTRTATLTATGTQLITYTLTPTPTLTWIASPTLTYTLSIVPSSTVSPSSTATLIFTPAGTSTLSQTITPSSTREITAVMTPQNTPTDTRTNTPVNTPSNTPANTMTNTYTTTPDDTPQGTATNTPANTATDTPTCTMTFTGTYTNTPAPNTPTNTETPENTSTATPVAAATPDTFAITDQIIYPNPYNVSQNIYFAFTASRDCGSVELKVYSVSFRLIMRKLLDTCTAGRKIEQLPQYYFDRFSNGIYYCVITAKSVTGENAVSRIQELLILK